MTIKKRLLVSNILMLIIPAFLSLIAALVLFLVFTGTIINRAHNNSELFSTLIKKTDQTFNSWSSHPNIQTIKSEMDIFNRKYKDKKISLLLYENNQLSYPPQTNVETGMNQIVQALLDDQTTHTVIVDHYAFYSKKINHYTAVLAFSDYRGIAVNNGQYRTTFMKWGLTLFVLITIIVSLTNYLLTKFILRRIVIPLEILNYGVHQIQLGNLDYRIEYKGQDEFSSVCSDFNLMAEKLRESVAVRKKDETSRKELIAGISHDLRTPLTSIKAFVEGLLDGIATTPTIQKNYLRTIKTKSEEIDQIVDKLFLFSKLDIGEFPFYPEMLPIGTELEMLVKSMSAEYQSKGLILKIVQNVKQITTKVDPVQFRNALINIFENSVKYKTKDVGILEIASFMRGGEVWITLTDDGPGVPEEALSKLFNIFYRSDPSRNNPSKGSGLGLAITAKILERFDGKIWAENVREGGLRIVITIPIYENTAVKDVEKDTDY